MKCPSARPGAFGSLRVDSLMRGFVVKRFVQIKLTDVSTALGTTAFIALTHCKTSINCSSFSLSVLLYIAMKVPLRPAPFLKLQQMKAYRLMTMSPLYPCGKPCSRGNHKETVKNLALFSSVINGIMMESRLRISTPWECFQFFNRIENSITFTP